MSKEHLWAHTSSTEQNLEAAIPSRMSKGIQLCDVIDRKKDKNYIRKVEEVNGKRNERMRMAANSARQGKNKVQQQPAKS